MHNVSILEGEIIKFEYQALYFINIYLKIFLIFKFVLAENCVTRTGQNWNNFGISLSRSVCVEKSQAEVSHFNTNLYLYSKINTSTRKYTHTREHIHDTYIHTLLFCVCEKWVYIHYRHKQNEKAEIKIGRGRETKIWTYWRIKTRWFLSYRNTGWHNKNGTAYIISQYVDAITGISVWGNFSWEKKIYQDQPF